MSTSRKLTALHARIVSGRGGGPEKTILNGPRFLADTRWREIALYLHARGDEGIRDLEATARERACPFVALVDRGPIDVVALSAIADLCRRENVRIWHGHDYKSNLYGLLLAPLLGLRLVSTVHGWVKHTSRTPLYYAIDRACLRRYERVVAVSRDLHEECLRIGVPEERVSLIENGIDLLEFRRDAPPAASPLRAQVPHGRLVLGAVGRLSEEKGFHHLIEAVAGALRAGLDLELWIAGEGDEHARLARLIDERGLQERVRLLGFRSDVRALMGAFDVFVLSSLREGLPNVVLEAMAMEVPLVATRCGGVEAVLDHDVEALLVAPGSSHALETALITLARDAALRARLARDARARVERDFSFARRMQRFAALYDELVRD